MRFRFLFLFLVMPVFLLSGCYRHRQLKGQARFGQLKMKPPVRVILFRATCVDQENLCAMIDTNHVTELVAKELEFRGFTVVDGATLVKDARYRTFRLAAPLNAASGATPSPPMRMWSK
jgi:hypothetical protein